MKWTHEYAQANILLKLTETKHEIIYALAVKYRCAKHIENIKFRCIARTYCMKFVICICIHEPEILRGILGFMSGLVFVMY